LHNDENFCCNGLIAADRSIHPALNEVKKVYQNIYFKAKDISKGIITVENLFDFTDLNQYAFRWELYRNGEKIKEDAFAVELAPHQQKDITLNVPSIATQDGSEYYINIQATNKWGTAMLEAGHVVATEQFKLSGDYFSRKNIASGNLQVKKEANKLSFHSGDVFGEIDLQSGTFTNYAKIDGVRLSQFPEPYFWRAPTDNDFGNGMPAKLGIWRSAHQNRKIKNIVVGDQTKEGVEVKVEYELTDIAVPYTVEYLIHNDGSVQVTASMDMEGRSLAELPRFGMRLTLPSFFTTIQYYGRGPWENYSDRNESAFVGLYKDDVKNQYCNGYIRPQESGYKTDVRWFSLTDQNGRGYRFEGIQPICFSAINHSTESLDPGMTKKQQHPSDLPPDQNIHVQVDYKQRGVGGDNSWGALPHERYRLLDKKYTYSYTIQLL
ncbi:MAG: DUF4981 domain-containing protein, partial [Bacteroidota bacterium]|nr:DUF4981 domain-containing protein [Bacteroidota bacterium]